MTLAVSRQGAGPDLVLLHGWGMHSGVWSELLPLLTDCFTVHCVDLPGHGDSSFDQQDSVDDWARVVLAVTPARAAWVGWSLGGLVGLAAAGLQPDRLQKLVLLAATPRFVTGPGWDKAVDADVLCGFSEQLENNYAQTLQRFLALQVMGGRHSGQTLKALRRRLLDKPQPDPLALKAGLSILASADFRAELNTVSLPLYWLLGQRDTLVPAQIAEQFPSIPCAVISGAGHAPFVSNPQDCADSLRHWLASPVAGAGHG